METYNIQGVEIFSVGTWNGDEYSMDDLVGMVAAFDANKTTVRPFLKLGHDEKQKLLQKDGYPAAGWIDRLYMRGEKLVADFSSIPKTIFELISNKAYRNVSSEIYCNVNILDQTYKYMLGAVALLGADTPGVMNLSDILGMYTKLISNEIKVYELTAPFGGEKKEQQMKTEAEIKLELDLKAKSEEIEAIKKDFSKSQDEAKAKDAELVQLREEKAASVKKEAELQAVAEQAKIAQFTTELISQKLIVNSMKPYVEALLEVEKKEYSFGDKKLSKQEVVSEMLKLFKAASAVNFVESSVTGVDDKKNSDKETDEKIKKYAAEHKVTYGTAAKMIISQQK